MGGDDSQKLLPWRGIHFLSGAQQTSGSLQNQHSSSKAVCHGGSFQAALLGFERRASVLAADATTGTETLRR